MIYQRDNDRRLLGLDDNVAVFRELLGEDWLVVPIVHDNAHEPCWLYSQLMDADMLLTPHGCVHVLCLVAKNKIYAAGPLLLSWVKPENLRRPIEKFRFFPDFAPFF